MEEPDDKNSPQYWSWYWSEPQLERRRSLAEWRKQRAVEESAQKQASRSAPELPEEDDTAVAVDASGQARQLPPSGLSARQRLEWANRHSRAKGRVAEPPLSDGELGMSREAFAKLPARQRLDIANEATAKRREA